MFAESISLPDGTVVQVRVLPNVPKATLVTVEPETEDDWEVLELNAELAEAAILSQVSFFLSRYWIVNSTIVPLFLSSVQKILILPTSRRLAF